PGELDAVAARQTLGQEASLEPDGELVLLDEAPGALERPGRLVGEGADHRPVVRLKVGGRAQQGDRPGGLVAGAADREAVTRPHPTPGPRVHVADLVLLLQRDAP